MRNKLLAAGAGLLLLAGCSTLQENAVTNAGVSNEGQDTVIISGISGVKTFLDIDDDSKSLIAEIRALEEVEQIRKALDDSETVKGNVNLTVPNFELVIHADGAEQEYYLWLAEQHPEMLAMLMKPSNPDVFYSLSQESTQSLTEVISAHRE
ncbi:hypothetical protein [Paenibacillus tepidiphilus]|uniref:hypothetical protein n=1 Tax=Paenibacillus tepidiphilus TaxID=2608683 RepID=UPI001239A576|nr:hypothetical protein [Paenibacillus tepidiphilus]